MDSQIAHAELMYQGNFADHIRDAEEAWEKAEAIPSVKSASVDGVRRFSVVYSYSCIATGKTISYGTHAVWDPTRKCYAESRPRPLLPDLSLRSSRGGVDVEILRQKNEAGQEIDVLNVFGAEGKLERSQDLGDQNLHGAVYFDATFGGIAISGDLTRAAFIAEAKEVKGCSFFKEEKKGDWAGRGQEFLYKEDFGEQLEQKRSPTIVELNIPSRAHMLKIWKGLPDNWCPGQLVYHPNGSSIIGSAHILGPRRLGLWACSNRPRIIFLLDESGGHKILSRAENVAAESPRVSPDGRFLYWMERDVGGSNGIDYGPHQACRRLVRRRLDIADGDIETVVPIVNTTSASDSKSQFRGLFIGELPKRPFSADGRFMVANTINCDNKIVLIVDVETKEVEVVEGPDCFPSLAALDVHLDFVLAEGSSLNRAPMVMCAALETRRGGGISLKGRLAFEFPRSRPDLKLPLEYKTFYGPLNVYSIRGTAILAMPVMSFDISPGDIRLVVFLHGGPNSSYQTSFNKQVYFFVQLGYAVLMVNYVGSTGNGQDGIDALTGRVGKVDVQDCYDIVQACFEVEKRIDKEDVYLYGGSHGGFLALHLAGKYPDAFKGVAVRNPVTHRSTKAAATDIPDIESNYAGLSYDYLPLNPDATQKLYEISPIALIRNIKAPVCLFLGKRDLRVPPHQGREFYHALKALGKKVRMYEYEDNHSLAKVTTAANAMVNASSFFFEIYERCYSA